MEATCVIIFIGLVSALIMRLSCKDDELHMHDLRKRMSALYMRDEELRKLREGADARREEARMYLAAGLSMKHSGSKRVVGIKKA